MRNLIRKLTVIDGIEGVDKDGNPFKTSLNLVVGVQHTIYIENQKERRPICEIEQTEDSYIIYVANGEIKSLWQEIPKSKKTLIEYYVE